MELTATNVDEITERCLSQEQSENIKNVEGITRTWAFDPWMLNLHADDIYSMLLQLPENFRKSAGGGWSFLCACNNNEGCQWGEHFHMEMLFCLGIAIGKVKFLLPRDLWSVLPGGVPYCMVLDVESDHDE